MLERTELRIALHDLAPLVALLVRVAGQEHPQILNARTIDAIIQIDQQRTALLPQDVAEMAVAVQADRGERSDTVEGRTDLLQQQRADLAEARPHVLGQQAGAHQYAARTPAPILWVERPTKLESVARTDGMNSGKRASEQLARSGGIELRGHSSAQRKH